MIKLDNIKIKFIFAWYDLWIGAYYDRKTQSLYILPIPTLGIKIEFNNTLNKETNG